MILKLCCQSSQVYDYAKLIINQVCHIRSLITVLVVSRDTATNLTGELYLIPLCPLPRTPLLDLKFFSLSPVNGPLHITACLVQIHDTCPLVFPQTGSQILLRQRRPAVAPV